MADDPRHQWVANEIGTHQLLNMQGGKALYYSTSTVDHSVTASTDAPIFSATVQGDLADNGAARMFRVSCMGQAALGDSAAALNALFKVQKPLDATPGLLSSAFTWRGYVTGDGSTVDLQGDVCSFAFLGGTQGGTYTFQLTIANIGTVGHSVTLKSGFQFIVEDMGRGF